VIDFWRGPTLPKIPSRDELINLEMVSDELDSGQKASIRMLIVGVE
jgi:hypothetical protein